MSKKTLTQREMKKAPISRKLSLVSPIQERSRQYSLRFVIALLLVVGIIIVAVVGMSVARSVAQATKGQNVTPTPSITMLSVRRTAPYAGLSITIMNAQEAVSFANDAIHAGQTTVRLNLHIANTTPHPVSVVYYDTACLLVPKMATLMPTNMQLATETLAGKSQDGWLDFSLPKAVPLDMLTLQLGSASLNETLVKIPFRGSFDSSQYSDQVVQESLPISYNYYGHTLLYRLTGVEVRLAFHGSQCNAGQRFYILDFSVDNPEGNDISPGYGFDYVRFVLNGNDRPPIETTLPYTFKAKVKNAKGYVVFAAPTGLKEFTLGLLSQNGNPELDTVVTL